MCVCVCVFFFFFFFFFLAAFDLGVPGLHRTPSAPAAAASCTGAGLQRELHRRMRARARRARQGSALGWAGPGIVLRPQRSPRPRFQTSIRDSVSHLAVSMVPPTPASPRAHGRPADQLLGRLGESAHSLVPAVGGDVERHLEGAAGQRAGSFPSGSSFGGRRMYRREQPEAAGPGRHAASWYLAARRRRSAPGELGPFLRVWRTARRQSAGGDALAACASTHRQSQNLARRQPPYAVLNRSQQYSGPGRARERFGLSDERPGGSTDRTLRALLPAQLDHSPASLEGASR